MDEQERVPYHAFRDLLLEDFDSSKIKITDVPE